MKCGIALPISGSRDSEKKHPWSTGQRMNESADEEEIELIFLDSDSVLLVHDTSMRFILQYVEFLILILRKVPDVVNTKLRQFSFHITPSAVT